MAVNILTGGFGVKGDGVSDDTAGISAAINTGDAVYFPSTSAGYKVKDALKIYKPGQLLFGDGRTATKLIVDSDFNLSAPGVIQFNTGEEGPILRDFGLDFQQPDTNIRNQLVAYPAAISAKNTPRFQIRNLGVYRALIGIDMTENSGGAEIDGLEASCFYYSVLIDGSLDTVRINNLHCWNFGLTSNQLQIFQNVGTQGIRSGRCDDLKLTNCLFICGTHLVLYQSSQGTTFGGATNCSFDTFTGLLMEAGNFSVVGGYFSLGIPNIPSIYHTGGTLRVTSADFQQGNSSSFPVISMSPDNSNADLNIDNCTFNTGGGDVTCIDLAASRNTQALANVSNCLFFRAPNISYSKPTISSRSAGGASRLTAIGNRCTDKGSGSGNFIYLGNTDWHKIIGNTSPGWSNTFISTWPSVCQYN
jgi:Pectate lyase superfamily protein